MLTSFAVELYAYLYVLTLGLHEFPELSQHWLVLKLVAWLQHDFIWASLDFPYGKVLCHSSEHTFNNK